MAVKHIIATQPPRFIALDNKQKIFTTRFKKLHKSCQIIFICKIKLHRNRIKRGITRIYILLFIIMNIHEFKYAFLAGQMSFPLYGRTVMNRSIMCLQQMVEIQQWRLI